MSSFLDMKKSRAASTGSLLENLKNAKGGSTYAKDERFYYPERDAQGVGFAVIRFLPTAKDNPAEFVRTYSHGFKGPGGKWFIEECPTSLSGGSCPVCEANSDIYNRSKEEYDLVGRPRKRKLAFTANILVVKDSKHPENEGQVRLFKFGSKIFDMISSAAKPEFEDKTPIDVFDMDEGANFNLRIVQKDGNTNYDKSDFGTPSAVAGGDAKAQEKIWEKEVDLREFSNPTRYKSYDELQKKFIQTVGSSAGSKPAGKSEDAPAAGSSRRAPTMPQEDTKESESVEAEVGEAEDPIAYFKALASGAKS